MSKIKNFYDSEINNNNIDDTQYFELLSEEEWQSEVERIENEYHLKYGYGIAYHLKFTEWLFKNK